MQPAQDPYRPPPPATGPVVPPPDARPPAPPTLAAPPPGPPSSETVRLLSLISLVLGVAGGVAVAMGIALRVVADTSGPLGLGGTLGGFGALLAGGAVARTVPRSRQRRRALALLVFCGAVTASLLPVAVVYGIRDYL